MATTYKLKRKTFSGNPQDPNQQQKSGGSGWGTVGKIGAGLAAVGGGLLAGKAGWLGAGIQGSIGRGMMNVGMVESGARTVAKSALTKANANLVKHGAKKMEGEVADAWIKKATDKQINFHKLKETEGWQNQMKAKTEAAAAKAKANSTQRDSYLQNKYGAAPTNNSAANATVNTTTGQALVYN